MSYEDVDSDWQLKEKPTSKIVQFQAIGEWLLLLREDGTLETHYWNPVRDGRVPGEVAGNCTCWPGDCREEPGNADHPQCLYCRDLDCELPCPADLTGTRR